MYIYVIQCIVPIVCVIPSTTKANVIYGHIYSTFQVICTYCVFSILQSGMWATYVPPEGDGENLKFYPCPPGYCSCVNDVITDISGTMCMYSYTNSNPDLQCSCNRKGAYSTNQQ